jgi:hypothetical protein
MSSSSTLSVAAALANVEKVKQKYARLIDVFDCTDIFGTESPFLKSITMPVARAAIHAAEAVAAEAAAAAAEAAHAAGLVTRDAFDAARAAAKKATDLVTSDIVDAKDDAADCAAALDRGIDIIARVIRVVNAVAVEDDKADTCKVIIAVAESYVTGDRRAADEAMLAVRS